MIKIENSINTFYDELNKSLWNKHEIVEEYKRKWQEARSLSRIQKEKLQDELSEKLDDFHKEFWKACDEIIKEVSNAFICELSPRQILEVMETKMKHSLLQFAQSWEEYINRNRLFDVLFDLFSVEDIRKLGYYHPSYVDDNYGKIYLDNASMFLEVLYHFGYTHAEVCQKINAHLQDRSQNTGESVSEDLEEASRNYADDEEYGDDVYFAIKAAFKSGAKWQMHNTWHKPYEKPEANISGLIVIYKDKTLGFINMDDVNEKLGLDIVSDGWAYLKDILPDNEDE